LVAAILGGEGIIASAPKLKYTLANEFIAFFISTKLATIRELKECLTYKDANTLWDIYEVDAINDRRERDKQQKISRLERRG
jgi:IS1 family transposase